MFYFLYVFLWLIAWLPLPILYGISDIFYPIIYHIIRYRRKIVRRNITTSFPDKSEQEIKTIERKFYRFFTDNIFETVYGMHLSEKELKKRLSFGNLELLENYCHCHKGCIAMLAHYANWEWISNLHVFLEDKQIEAGSIYRQLKNKKFDKLMYDIRKKHGSTNIEKKMLLRKMVTDRNSSIIGAYGMIADQTPSAANLHYWTNFLHQDTAFLTGSETLAGKFDYPVVYMKVSRPKRGYFHCDIIPIAEKPQETDKFEITEKYARLLENTILEEPAYWLWSHNRWKHKR